MIELHENEKVVIITRRHWYVFLAEIITLFLGLVVPAIFIYFAEDIYGALSRHLSGFQVVNLLIFISAAWLFFLWVKFFSLFTDYYLDILIVTNQRVIDVEQKGLFARDIANATLENAQDIKIEMLGIIPTFFRFGNLYFQTAASEKEICVRGVKNPEEVKRTIISTFNAKDNQIPAKVES